MMAQDGDNLLPEYVEFSIDGNELCIDIME